MNKSLIVLRHEFLKTFKSKSFIILTIALPLVLVAGMGIFKLVTNVYQPSAAQEVKIGYIDQAGTFGGYTEKPGLKFVSYASEADAKAALIKGDVSQYFVIPADYVDSGKITRYTLAREVGPSPAVTAQIQDFLLSNLLGSSISPRVMARARAPLLLSSVRIEKTGEVAPSQDIVSTIVVPLIFAVLFMISIFTISSYLFNSVTEEKENRIIEILLSSLSSWQLLVGKIIGLGLAGLIQITVWLTTIAAFSGLAPGLIPALSSTHIPATLILWALVYFILGYLLFSSLYAGVGSMGQTAKEAQGWSMIFTLPAILPYYFSYFIISRPESVLSRVLTFFPLTSPMTVIMRLSVEAIAPWEVALSLLILSGSVVGTIWLASRMFRVFLLMYGKRPAPKDIFRYIREA